MQRRRHMTGLIIGALLMLAAIGGRPVGAQDLPSGEPFVGRANGFGNIAIAPGLFSSFSFRIDPLTVGQLVPGQVRFINRLTGETVVSQQITGGFIIPGLVFVEGVCTVDGRLSVFQMEAFDASRPGERDNFFICYGGSFTGTCVGGLLGAGNIIVRQERFR
jgi:hypothetical protein